MYLQDTKQDAPLLISMDANFGLVRKKSSGAALKEDHVANPFFCNQKEVDKFVTEMGTNDASKSKVNYMN